MSLMLSTVTAYMTICFGIYPVVVASAFSIEQQSTIPLFPSLPDISEYENNSSSIINNVSANSHMVFTLSDADNKSDINYTNLPVLASSTVVSNTSGTIMPASTNMSASNSLITGYHHESGSTLQTNKTVLQMSTMYATGGSATVSVDLTIRSEYRITSPVKESETASKISDSSSIDNPDSTTKYLQDMSVQSSILPSSMLSVLSSTDMLTVPSTKPTGNINNADSRNLHTSEIIGIAVGSSAFVIVIGVMIGIVCCRRLHTDGRSKSPNGEGNVHVYSNYLDDAMIMNYIGHIQLPKETTEEMISLDNDAFLHSLEAETFTNCYYDKGAKNTHL